MKNYIEEFKKDNGLIDGESFEVVIDGDAKRFNFSGTALYFCYTAKDIGYAKDILFDLLRGKLKVIRPPFKPEKGEMYWTLEPNNQQQKICAMDLRYRGSGIDILTIKAGFCYRTKAEAEANIDKFKAYIADVVGDCNG